MAGSAARTGGAAAPAGDEADLADDRALLDRHGDVRIGLADLDLQRALGDREQRRAGSLRRKTMSPGL
jgi:hypothetical protein